LGSDAPWQVVWNNRVYDDLAALDKTTAGKIIARVETYLAQDPVNLGKHLTGPLAGIFRYRYGAYRILYVMDFGAHTVTILAVRHRRAVYRG
jgi:mRNA interferase RelE/StbE